MSLSIVLKAIQKHQGEHLTVRRLCEITGFSSTSTVHRYIKLLEDSGTIRRVQTYEVISDPATPKKKRPPDKSKVDTVKSQERILQLREVMGFE